MNCNVCKDTGWIEAEGRLGLEIQMCQECFICKSDEEAYNKAGLVIDVSKYKYDQFEYVETN
jgi:hypothetical protein|tara:strand:+ start:218 stop:403 length:186 start_codon:yes stop_codon:yes gene_type:complete